ncbi:glycosyltransferase family 4 protein [Aestuariispira insulae]|uniref:Glycosyltransferase involved in cell wall biosynthesis n=1 Tax=Aestuariispira insulae TaxID=1461337 RepID=A0A3D9HK87_9PROT|nr:glycosyltransferase family 4 protein [Aestuariispira insulae]RED49883.1 glycosyltransferase involved in cell wall biosynthesis [Aestuariispira insulae]
MIKILTFTSLFPNQQQPNFGVFVENRLRHLKASGEVEAKVLAPVPWFPIASDRFGKYGKLAQVPEQEIRHGLEINHPRFPVIPKIGMIISPYLLYRAMRPIVRRIIESGYDFDLLDAHYFYPDGVAAALLARDFNKPFIITARGADLNQFPGFPIPKKWIRWAADQADGIITVSNALTEPLKDLCADMEKVTFLRNGVDLTGFQPMNQEQARQKYSVSGKIGVSVGGLIERKGHHITIDAVKEIPDLTFLIAGEGPERANLEAQIARNGLKDRVRLLGAVPHKELSELFSAADFSVLSSSSEGWANVLLESMASGTPVVATRIGGTDEVVTAPEAGLLVDQRAPGAIADGIRTLLDNMPERTATRAYAEKFSWDDTTQGQLRLFRKILAQEPGRLRPTG